MKDMDNFVKLFEKTQLEIERLQGIVSEVSRLGREGKTKGLENNIQFIIANSKNLDRYEEVRIEFSMLLDRIAQRKVQ
jgi:hypothetical protein